MSREIHLNSVMYGNIDTHSYFSIPQAFIYTKNLQIISPHKRSFLPFFVQEIIQTILKLVYVSVNKKCKLLLLSMGMIEFLKYFFIRHCSLLTYNFCQCSSILVFLFIYLFFFWGGGFVHQSEIKT